MRGQWASVGPGPSTFADNERLERRFKRNMSHATRDRKFADWAGAEWLG